jgi:Fic family protein
LGDIAPPDYTQVPQMIQTYLDSFSGGEKQSLIKAAVGHYQFESIHPFSDGNGRTGRLLVIAHLLHYGWLKEPVLNLSGFFERNRGEYVGNLRQVTEKRDYRGWADFFLRGIIEQAKEALTLIAALKELRENDLNVIRKNVKGTPLPVEALDFALNRLYVTTAEFGEYLSDLSAGNYRLKDAAQTARSNIQRLERCGILAKSHRRRNADVYCHAGLRKILMGA